jgi:hypothetical protein
MFKNFLDTATSTIKNRASEAISNSLDLATDTLISGKDTTQSTIIKNGLNIFIKKFGEIKNLKIDSQNKAITLDIFLKGEADTIILNIENYKFFKDDDDIYYIKIFDISANRYWIDAIAKVFTRDKQFPIPSQLVIPMKILI